MDTVQQTQAGSATGTRTAMPPSGTGVISSDFETFLVMLTAQIENQDPLNPIDSTEYAAQLATFAGVEQQVLTNQLLSNISGGGSGALGELAGWIGMDARHSGPVRLDGNPVPLTLPESGDATRRELVVKAETGEVVERRDLAGAQADYVWSGQMHDGTRLPDGIYNLEVAAHAADGTITTMPVASYARVAEIRSTNGGIEVVLEGGQITTPEEISALRAAD